jgi:hypothetical protein
MARYSRVREAACKTVESIRITGFESPLRLNTGISSPVTDTLARYSVCVTKAGFRAVRSPEALSYLAGLLEGEGSFLVGPAGAVPAVALAMTDEDVVRRASYLMEATTFALGTRRSTHKDV